MTLFYLIVIAFMASVIALWWTENLDSFKAGVAVAFAAIVSTWDQLAAMLSGLL